MDMIERHDKRAESVGRWLRRIAIPLSIVAAVLFVSYTLPVALWMFQQAELVGMELVGQIVGIGAFFFVMLGALIVPRIIASRKKVSWIAPEDPIWVWAIVLLGGIGLGVAAGFGADRSGLGEDTLGNIGAVVLVAASIVWFLYRMLRKSNVDDARYQLVRDVAHILGRDMAPSAPLAVQLDLDPPDAPRKLADSNKYRSAGATFWTNAYSDPWLSMSGQLIDGTRFRLRMIDRAKTKNRVRDRKSKLKCKSKCKYQAVLQLRVKPQKCPGLARMKREFRQAVQVPDGATVHACTITPDGLQLKVAYVEQTSLKHLAIGMLLSGFQVINLGKREQQ